MERPNPPFFYCVCARPPLIFRRKKNRLGNPSQGKNVLYLTWYVLPGMIVMLIMLGTVRVYVTTQEQKNRRQR